MSDARSMTLWDYYHILFRYKFRMVAIMAVAIGLGFTWIAYAPREYESEAKLFIRVGWENAGLDPTINKADAVAINISRESEITTMLEHLRCRPILEKAMDLAFPSTLELPPLARERAFAIFKSRLSITSPKSSMVIRIAAKGDTPEQAHQTVSVLTKLFMDDHLQLSRPAGSYEFLTEQSNRLRDEFETAQAKLRDAKNRGDLASIQGRRSALESQINAVQTRINDVTASLSAADAKMRTLKASIDNLPEPLLKQMMAGAPNDGIATMRDKLFQLQAQLEEARSKFKAAHPRVLALKTQVEEMAALLKEENPERDEIVQAICANDNSSRAALVAQKQSLQSQLVDLRKELVDLNENEILVTQCEVNVRHLESKYLSYATKTEDARIDNALLKDKISNVQVIQPASLSVLPVSPQKSNILLFFMVLGLVGGIGIALLSDQWDTWRESTRKHQLKNRSRGFKFTRVARHGRSNKIAARGVQV
jgi:uncharacterized protein involved in exopolysaccharide biosynthesis